jgi:hypothetical protein
MNDAVSWDVTLCGSCKNECLGGTDYLHHQGGKNQRTRKDVSSNWQLKHTVKKHGLYEKGVEYF